MTTENYFLVAGGPVISGSDPYLLTIAIPTFRRAVLLRETLQSVAALRFRFPVEVIVVDNDPDGDDEGAEALLATVHDFPCCYYRNRENLGMFGNWNQCLSLAKGKYITILHDDDLLGTRFAQLANELLVDGRLEGEIVGFGIAVLEQRPERAGLGRPAPSVDAAHNAAPVAARVSFSVRELFVSNRFCGTLAVIVNRQRALEIGAFDAAWYPIADYEFWCRWAARLGPISFVQAPVAQYRIAQNESIKVETRNAFVVRSAQLRRELVVQGAVPRWYGGLIATLRHVQAIQIYRDWRTEAEAPVTVYQRVMQRLCARGFDLMVRLGKQHAAPSIPLAEKRRL